MSVNADPSLQTLLSDFAENGVDGSAGNVLSTLDKIAAHLPEALLIKALDIASEREEGWDRADAVNILAPYLPAHLMPKALDIVGGVHGFGENFADYDEDRVKALLKLAAYVPEHLMPRVLALAYETQGESERVMALTGLIQYLPDILPEVVVLGRQISLVENRIYALIELLPYFPDLVPEILSEIRNCEDKPEFPRFQEDTQSWSLVKLTPYLPDHLLPEAANIAQRIVDKKYRLTTVTALVVRMPELRSAALALARGIEEEYERAEAMTKLSVSLPDIGPEVLDVINSIQDDATRWRSLKNSIQYLPKHCMPAVLKMIKAFQSEARKVLLLFTLITHAPQGLLLDISEMVNEMEIDPEMRGRILKKVEERMSQSNSKISITEN